MKPALGLVLLSTCIAPAAIGQGKTASGQAGFERNCGTCHGGDGLGGEMGPNIANRLANFSDDQLSELIHEGRPNRGMPGFPKLAGQEQTDLMAFLRTIRTRRRASPLRKSIELENGARLTGLVLNESPLDVQLRTNDGRVHLLRPSAGKYREATSQSDWTTYNGDIRGNRYSVLPQITPENVRKLAPRWIFTLDGATSRGQTTPIVVEGIMYVTGGNECWALDAGAGREIWHFQRPRTKGLVGNAAQGMNRGVAWAGDRVFMVTDNAHLLALNRFTGELLWETEMADWRQNYNATSAPLYAHDLVITWPG